MKSGIYDKQQGKKQFYVQIKYLFIAVCQHIPHTVNQKGKVGPLLKRLVPAPLHDLIPANVTASQLVPISTIL